jgi:uncharacterized ion transporter superfamily protein YfcC
MPEKAGAQISTRAFLQSLAILLALMLAAGMLTRWLPAGSYQRATLDGREVIDPQSYQVVERPDYPAWRWLTAPLEVLAGPDGATIIVIIVFLLLVGASFAVLERTGLIRAALAGILKRFGVRKYLLLLLVSLFFMSIGAFFGIFEEVIPLVPVMIALSYSLGWDALVGLGMSILATNMGFSAAVTNPFTLGVAQRLAGLPLFSGAGLRLLIFAVVYGVFAHFLVGYARRIERRPEYSPVYTEDQPEREKYSLNKLEDQPINSPHPLRASLWLATALTLIVLVLIGSPFVPALSAVSLPLVGLLFFAGGLGAGFLSGTPGRAVWAAARGGLLGILPAVPLILMAASVKHIVALGGVLDTILHQAARAISSASPFAASILIYLVALGIEFFIGSGSAKAFLLMPILLPLADLVGVTRQVAVTAYCFGDGFSNLAYPTNPVLLIALGLTVVSYPKWLRWTLKLWFLIILITVLFLALAVWIGYGPF